MVSESLPSPGYRRSTSSPFKRSLSSSGSSWRSLAHRHKFLLHTLGLLTLLCTVYLYFAITWGASDSCSGLGGTQRALCQLRGNKLKSDSFKAHHRRLLYVDDSDDLPKTVSSGRLKEFEAFFSSRSSEDLKEIEITRLRGTINDLRRVIGSLRRGNARLRKTLTILRSDHHTPTSTKEDNTNKEAIPVPPRGARLRGDI